MDKWYVERSSLDDFWDLDSLLPPKREKKQIKGFTGSITPETVTATAVEDAPARAPQERRISAVASEEEGGEVREYRPKENCLIDTVRIHTRREPYPFYGRFRRDAERYLDCEGEECPFVHFFSYIPQYTQLNEEQLAYYLYWRTAARRGEYLRTEESYFYLYVYEIINLPDKIPPSEGALLLSRIWRAYRTSFPRIDKYMAAWLCDYCLVHGLPCPQDELRPFRAKILPEAELKEFYLGELGKPSTGGTDTALAFFSDYRFRDSRYAQGDTAKEFERHILAAVTPVLSDFLEKEERGFAGATLTRTVHDAFCGSLCAHQIRSRIEVLYYRVADVAPLRALLTGAVKYAENKLRARMSVKSRLSVQGLSPVHRAMIDAYFSALPPSAGEGKIERAAYESLYDAPSEGVDFAAAAAIEERSWQTTERLVLEEDSIEPPALALVNNQKTVEYFTADEKNVPASPQDTMTLTPTARVYLCHLLAGDSAAARRAAQEAGRLEGELADEINEYAMTRLDDVALEAEGDGYAVIPDYLDEVTQWTK